MKGNPFLTKRARVVVIGLDGATFDVIRPLVKRGRLPNLATIMENGVHGELKSTVHPITPQAWTTFLTGKMAGKHGIFDFTSRKRDSYEIQFVNASRRKAESIFSILSRAGKTVGAIAVPFTFPPEKVNGFMLSGLDAPAEDNRAVYPEWLYKEIKQEIGHYFIHLASPVGRKIDQDGFWRDIVKEDENRTQISQYLMRKYPCDLFMTVYNNTDRVAHQHLDETLFEMIQGDGPLDDDDLLIRTYENTDKQVGTLLPELDDSTYVIVMSDHGSGPIRRFFFLNNWLEKNGFLTFKRREHTAFLRAVHMLRYAAKRFLPRRAKDLIETRMGALRDKVESTLSFSDIEWTKTKAFGFGMYGNIYINLKGREPLGVIEQGNECEALRDEIVEKLSNLRDPDRDERIIEKVYRREELYQGSCVDSAPDLLIRWKDYAYYTSVAPGIEQGSIFGPHMNIDCSEYKHVGTHRLDGIFMAMGGNIRQGAGILGAEICDVAPTILYMLGQPIPKDMDGKVLTEIFDQDFLRNNPPRYERSAENIAANETLDYSDEEGAKVAERLRGLGYLE